MIKLFKNISLLFLCTILLSSCNDDDTSSVFGDSPTERQNQRQEELSQLLQSSAEGWKMTYFTDDPRYTDDTQQLGGWTFVMKFTDDQHVTMVSDFSQQTLEPKESLYEIKPGSTTELSFATKNWISLLTDSGNYPTSNLEGYGYKGDNEFLYYGQEGEDIIFRSNRLHIEIHFQKATAEDWTSLDEARQTGQLLTNSGNFEVEIKNGSEITNNDNYVYSPNARFATNTEVDSLSFGIAPKPDGLKVIKPITVGNEEAIDFTYDATNNSFISNLSNGNYVKIKLGEPLLVSDIVNTYYFSFQAFSGSPNLGFPTSDAFFEKFNEAFDNFDQASDSDLFGFFFVPDNVIEYIFVDDSGNFTVVDHNITSTTNDANFTITSTGGTWSENDLDYGTLLAPLDDLILDPQGLIISSTGTVYDGEPVFALTSVTNPDVVFAVYSIAF